MLRAWIWCKTVWETEDGWFDRLAHRARVRAALLVGLVFGLVEWATASLIAWSVLPFAAFLGTAIVGTVTFGPILVWLRGRRRAQS